MRLVRCLMALELAPILVACGSSPATQTGTVSFPRFGDTDPHLWTDRTPWSYPVHGLDVSRFQGDIDWRQARRAGIRFAFLKATEGGDLLDPTFETNWRATRSGGIRRGAYHFYYFCRSARDQARWFIRNVSRDPNALPHVLDLEWNPFSPTCTFRPHGATVRSEARMATVPS